MVSPTKDASAIAALCAEYPNALHDALMMHSNAALLVLRVLHKFRIHPQLKALKRLDWSAIEAGAKIERLLKQ